MERHCAPDHPVHRAQPEMHPASMTPGAWPSGDESDRMSGLTALV